MASAAFGSPLAAGVLPMEMHGLTLALRLLTSDEDYFLEPTRKLAKALIARKVVHHLDVVSGTHSYEFNRGPGGYEMLLFNDRALRSAAAPAPWNLATDG